MNWDVAEQLLENMTEAYTRDSIRKVAFGREIFPLILRFQNKERSEDLYQSITRINKILMTDINQRPHGSPF